MKTQQRIFFDFLRFCIEASSEIPKSIEEADRHELYDIAKKQALVGVLFHGIQQLPKELAPDEDLLMQWMGMAQRIKQKNMRLFMDSAKFGKHFSKYGHFTQQGMEKKYFLKIWRNMHFVRYLFINDIRHDENDFAVCERYLLFPIIQRGNR